MKVGDYVRTKYGIAKVISTKVKDEDGNNVFQVDRMLEPYFYGGCDEFLCDSKDVIKTSPNIIDLIEVGDYVNGGIVKEITKHYIRMNETKELLFQFIDKDKPEDIKSIVTKEQFERMQYNLESEVN